MKTRFIQIGIFITAILFLACTAEQSMDEIDRFQKTKGEIEIEVDLSGATEHDYIHSARFIVFDDASVFPTIDINKRIEFEDNKKDATIFTAKLQVSCNDDKQIIVILNEPSGLTNHLNTIFGPHDLLYQPYVMEYIFNQNHTAPLSRGIPMTGITRDVTVTEEDISADNPKHVNVTVTRSVARAELWLRAESGSDATLNASTMVSLHRSFVAGFLMAPADANGMGSMMIAYRPDLQVDWNYQASTSYALPSDYQFITAFYTPERTCNLEDDLDKLILTIDGINTAYGVKNAISVLSRFSPKDGGSPQRITEIRRNNIYRILGTVKENGINFEQVVLPWKDVSQDVIADPQYFLNLSEDDIFLPSSNLKTIRVETNYDRDDDRGFPKGLRLRDICYYDRNNQQIHDSNSELYGWLFAVFDGSDDDLERDLLLINNQPFNEANSGSYATVEVRAGNLIKLIKVRR